MKKSVKREEEQKIKNQEHLFDDEEEGLKAWEENFLKERAIFLKKFQKQINLISKI